MYGLRKMLKKYKRESGKLFMLKTSHTFRIDNPESPTDIPESHTPLALFINIKYVLIKLGLMLLYDKLFIWYV